MVNTTSKQTKNRELKSNLDSVTNDLWHWKNFWINVTVKPYLPPSALENNHQPRMFPRRQVFTIWLLNFPIWFEVTLTRARSNKLLCCNLHWKYLPALRRILHVWVAISRESVFPTRTLSFTLCATQRNLAEQSLQGRKSSVGSEWRRSYCEQL